MDKVKEIQMSCERTITAIETRIREKGVFSVDDEEHGMEAEAIHIVKLITGEKTSQILKRLGFDDEA